MNQNNFTKANSLIFAFQRESRLCQFGKHRGERDKRLEIEMFWYEGSVRWSIQLRIFGKGLLFFLIGKGLTSEASGVKDLFLFLHVKWILGKCFFSFACIFLSINLTSGQTTALDGQELKTDPAVGSVPGRWCSCCLCCQGSLKHQRRQWELEAGPALASWGPFCMRTLGCNRLSGHAFLVCLESNIMGTCEGREESKNAEDPRENE